MKPAGFLLLVPVGLACLAGADETTTGLVSKETKAHVLAGLPTFQAKPAPDAAAEADSANADNLPPLPDANLLVLPTMTVKEKRLPPDAADHLMSPKAFNRKMTNLYLDDLDRDGPLEAFLNRLTIPLLSPSRAARGRALALGKELDRLSSLLSPAEAKDLNGFYDELALTLGRRAPKRR
jgi:hypothetical protein